MHHHVTRRRWWCAAIVGVLSSGCWRGPLPQGSGDVRLRQYSPIALIITTPSGTSSLVRASGAGTSTAEATSAVDLFRRASDLLSYEMQALGFTMSIDTIDVEGIAEITLGRVGFESQRGWIAQDATVLIRRPNSRAPLAIVRSDARFTSGRGADALIVSLARELRKLY